MALGVPQITEPAYELRRDGLPLPLGILTREELMQYLVPLLRRYGKGAEREDA